MARVALVCEPPDGGVAEHVAALALGLPAHGHEAVVLGPRDFLPAQRLAAAGREFHPLGLRRGYGAPQRDALALGELVRVVRRGEFDLVHAHSSKAGVLGRLAAVAARLPSVYSPHLFGFAGGGVGRRRRLFALGLERALAPLTAAIVCVCEQERDVARAARLRPRGRLAVVLNGCAPCVPAPPDPELELLRRRGPVVGAVAVLRPDKRLDVLVDAAPRILAAVPEASVAIVGDGPGATRLQAQAGALGVEIAFRPFRAPSAAALRSLDLYVLPSGREALSIGLLEALACGVPQVATDVGGSSEAVSAETGVLVAPGDPGALAEAVIALLRDPARREGMAAASRARHAQLFTLDRMVAETAALYDSLLAQ